MFLSKDAAPPKLCNIHSILVRLDEKDVNAELCCFTKFSQTAPSRNMHAFAQHTHVAKLNAQHEHVVYAIPPLTITCIHFRE